MEKYLKKIALTLAVTFGMFMTSVSHVSANIYTYEVKSGDTLWIISQKLNVTLAQLKELNHLSSNMIFVGQILKYEPPIKHQVQSGETLWIIANKYGTTIDDIQSFNNLQDHMLYVGQTLLIAQQENSPLPHTNHTTYNAQSGDTLWIIAQKFHTTIAKLKSINDLTNDYIYPGQTLIIANDRKQPIIDYINYTVKQGDTVWSISIDHGIPMQELLNINGLSMNESLMIGQNLTIPVHNVPIKETIGAQYGEYLDWWEGAQYVFSIGEIATVRDFYSGITFQIKRTIGANHADCEPLTSKDANIIKQVWGGEYNWSKRPVIIIVDGRRIAASMTSTPHGIQYIKDNHFNGHFDLHFANSTRHKDGLMTPSHQEAVKIAAGLLK